MTEPRIVRVGIVCHQSIRRRQCLCCNGEGRKDGTYVGVFDQLPDGTFDGRDSGSICEECLQGDVLSLLAAEPYPAIPDGSVPSFAELKATRLLDDYDYPAGSVS
ncbi:MAG TPA: hypothetical protein VNJ04_20585 [Gemmatimonadaceae bacterium]|nr:hypothetical protein [Gemmatimonadaceae bacterium]